MNFKANMLRDLDTTFFNEDEHAERVEYYPLGDLNEEPIQCSVIFDAIVVDEDVMNSMSSDIIDNIPRIEGKQSDFEGANMDSLVVRVKTGVVYRLIANEYFNDNGVIEFHLERVPDYGA